METKKTKTVNLKAEAGSDFQEIYFDNGATTAVDQRVINEMLPYWNRVYGNPSSLHRFGREAKDTVEKSRHNVASSIGAHDDELFFTGSGTEANNTALKGIAYANKHRGNHFIVSRIEHDCIINTCKWLQTQGFEVTYLPVDSKGLVDIETIRKNITKSTLAVSVMHVNNEIGTVQPIAEIGALCKQHGIYFHADACQSYGKIKLDINHDNIDLATISAHKIYGPKGIGGLFIRNGVKIEPLLHGGGQERGIRSATENVAGIVGFAKAAELCFADYIEEAQRLTILRDKIINTISERIEVAYLNGDSTKRLPGNINLGFHGLEGEAIKLLLELDQAGVAVSSGSACSSNDAENKPSHVLQAIGLNPIEARGALRIGLGRFTTTKNVDDFLEVFFRVFKKLRPISPGC